MNQTEPELQRIPPDEADRLDDWVRAAQRGEVAEFERIYRRFGGQVYTMALRFTADVERAEELTQDVFIRLWKKLDRFRWESSFATWLHRLAVNAILSGLRRDGRRFTWELLAEDVSALAGPARSTHPGKVLDLERAIAALPAGARTIFLLHDLEGFRHQEIADVTGLAVGTSKAQLHRARRLLREALTQ